MTTNNNKQREKTRRQVLGGLAGVLAGYAIGSNVGDDGPVPIAGGAATVDMADVTDGLITEFQIAATVDELVEPDELPAVAFTEDAGWYVFDESGN